MKKKLKKHNIKNNKNIKLKIYWPFDVIYETKIIINNISNYNWILITDYIKLYKNYDKTYFNFIEICNLLIYKLNTKHSNVIDSYKLIITNDTKFYFTIKKLYCCLSYIFYIKYSSLYYKFEYPKTPLSKSLIERLSIILECTKSSLYFTFWIIKMLIVIFKDNYIKWGQNKDLHILYIISEEVNLDILSVRNTDPTFNIINLCKKSLQMDTDNTKIIKNFYIKFLLALHYYIIKNIQIPNSAFFDYIINIDNIKIFQSNPIYVSLSLILNYIINS